MIITSPFGIAKNRMYLEQYGSYSKMFKAGTKDSLTGIITLPPLSKERHEQLLNYAFNNWNNHILFKYEQNILYTQYKEWRKINKPTFWDKLNIFIESFYNDRKRKSSNESIKS